MTKRNQIIYWLAVCLVFGLAVLATIPNTTITIVGAACAWLMGFSVIYSYIHGHRIDFGWATVEKSGSRQERSFYLFSAIAVIILAITGLVKHWH